ncbi:outer membrane lipoprotein LolB [Zoogloea sp.]|uniref:outer membrane lipoprotein LolB n=1 Tax=Zoogloea sp. TaxID=49181 RepID=UPI0014164E2A|nr:MAG: outer membrane lipoprotein LolB [Zoogloea sp.]
MRPLVLLWAAALAGCALQPVGGPPVALRAAAELASFQLEGRLQVRDGERQAVAGLSWLHGPEGDEWLLTGPLGQGLARIDAQPGRARMTLADGRRLEASGAAELAEAALGVAAPFAEMPLWATARIRPGAEVREVDSAGRPRRVVDRGWTIEYTEYVGEGPDDLPRKIDVHRGDTRLRLIVDAWSP